MSCEILQHFTAYTRDLLTKIFYFQIDNYAESEIFSFHEKMKPRVCEFWGVCLWKRGHTFSMYHFVVL